MVYIILMTSFRGVAGEQSSVDFFLVLLPFLLFCLLLIYSAVSYYATIFFLVHAASTLTMLFCICRTMLMKAFAMSRVL